MSERVTVIHADCREALKSLADCSIDACITDPPYALVSITKRFGKPNSAPVKVGNVRASNDLKAAYARQSAGFMGKQWDNGSTAFDPDFWREVLRVLKPGAHVVSFGGTRTYHRLVCAIEDAGFEIRDQLQWLFGSGFPKSHDVSKGIDRANGDVREVVGMSATASGISNKHGDVGGATTWNRVAELVPITSAASAASAAWEGWGTALKPASEPICLARKPLSEKTVAANVLRWGTGALNIDACRVESVDIVSNHGETGNSIPTSFSLGGRKPMQTNGPALGRWPANVCHDGSEEVLAAFPESDGQAGTVKGTEPSSPFANVYGDMPDRAGRAEPRGDSGSAARFFFTAKADADDRLGSKHPTVKPVELMRWLARLVTPPNGMILDPFAGTGTTGIAAIAESFRATLIEREDEYVADIRTRLEYYAGRGPLTEQLKQRNRKPQGSAPLFEAAE
jgi:site-specific DNA-methyltransferase (adenine-specific)